MESRNSRKMSVRLNRKRIQRLMRLMGIEAIYPKPRTTQRNKEHRIYPYLLRNLQIDHKDQVWSADITYVPIQSGFMYLAAVMDWHTRYVLSWRLSNTLDSHFCVDAPLGCVVDQHARDFQHRSRLSIYEPRVHVASFGRENRHQHGWPWPSDRQRVH